MSKDPYRYFRVEAREIVDGLQRGLMALEQTAPAGEPLAVLMRLAHTLKGAARVVKRADIADLAHALEDALGAWRDRATPLAHAEVDALLAQVDSIDATLATLTAPPPPGAPGAPEPPAPSDVALETAVDPQAMEALLDALAAVGASIDALRAAAARLPAVARAAFGAPGAQLRGIERGLDAVAERLLGDLGDASEQAQRMRLTPVAPVLVHAHRAARDAASVVGKAVEVRVAGGEVRLDAALLAAIRDALVQLVRNAVDHGIEPAHERVAAGKPAAGQLELRVDGRAGRVVFECRDDGRGVDLAALRAAGARLGLPGSTAGSADDQALALMVQPGVSTRGEATAVSGRGVGLDVVQSVVTRLGGEMRVRTAPGLGTTVSLSVPVSLASVPALLVEASGLRAAVPLGAVRSTRRVAERDLAHPPDGEQVLHEGAPVPLLRLSDWVGAPPRAGAGAVTIVVVEADAELAALGVERASGARRLVMQALPDAVGTCGASGAAVDADGRVLPVLDARRIVAAARSRARRGRAAEPPRAWRVLVIDDSLTTRMLERSILESAGYEVDVASSGEQALDMAERRPYDLFIVDVEMPGMSGFDFVARTRQSVDLRGVPSIVVTSRDTESDRRRGLAAGARGYVVKSRFAADELLSLVASLVG